MTIFPLLIRYALNDNLFAWLPLEVLLSAELCPSFVFIGVETLEVDGVLCRSCWRCCRCGTISLPHLWQNFAFCTCSAPHTEQNVIFRLKIYIFKQNLHRFCLLYAKYLTVCAQIPQNTKAHKFRVFPLSTLKMEFHKWTTAGKFVALLRLTKLKFHWNYYIKNTLYKKFAKTCIIS